VVQVRVVFVDDETDFLETVLKRMQKRKIETVGFESGPEALEWLRSNPTDVVVLDVRMPDMDGLQVLEEIKKIDALIEVIMLTGHASLESAEKGMEMGAFDYLMKPINMDELLFKIEDAHQKKLIAQRQNEGGQRG
jgi:DNA-binding NtrC family response regulator